MIHDTTLKASFLKQDYTPIIRQLAGSTAPLFGRMDVQQMIEHMAEHIRQGYGNPPLSAILTPEEHLPRMQAFLMSDKPFRENTPNPLLPDIPPPHRHPHISIAADDLQQSVNELFTAFDAAPTQAVLNPFFGMLNYEQTIHLLYKHAWHHLAQFGITRQSQTGS